MVATATLVFLDAADAAAVVVRQRVINSDILRKTVERLWLCHQWR